MEAANHHILETVALDLSPVLNLVAGDILRIAGHIVRGEGVGSFSTDSGHQLVVLVGDEVLGCHLRDAVDLMVLLLAGLGIRQSAVFLVALFDLVEQRCFGSHVVRAEMGGALKHQVLQIVRQTGGLCRIVLRTCTHGDIGLNTRTLRVHREIHLQTVVEGIDARLHQVARHRRILIILCLDAHPEHHRTNSQ